MKAAPGSTPTNHAIRHRLKEVVLHVPSKHNALYEREPGYTFDDWVAYRSPVWRMRIQPAVIFQILLGMWVPLLLVAVISVLSCSYFYYLVPLGAPSGQNLVSLLSVFTFFVTLLMVFKLNSSYARWWEARTLWGSMLAALRSYVSLLMTRITPETRHVTELARRWVPAAALLLKEHLRQYGDGPAAVSHLLQPHEMAWLKSCPNKPLAAAHVLHTLAVQATPCVYAQTRIQEQVTAYMLYSAGCERILRTPLPTGYSRFTSRACISFVVVVPITLWGVVGWATPIVACFIAFIILGVENVGVQIEEPFRVLHLESLCDAVEAGARDLCPYDSVEMVDLLCRKEQLEPHQMQMQEEQEPLQPSQEQQQQQQQPSHGHHQTPSVTNGQHRTLPQALSSDTNGHHHHLFHDAGPLELARVRGQVASAGSETDSSCYSLQMDTIPTGSSSSSFVPPWRQPSSASVAGRSVGIPTVHCSLGPDNAHPTLGEQQV